MSFCNFELKKNLLLDEYKDFFLSSGLNQQNLLLPKKNSYKAGTIKFIISVETSFLLTISR